MDTTELMDRFVICYIGTVAMFDGAVNKTKIRNYLSDTGCEAFSVVQDMKDAGLFSNERTAADMAMLLSDIASGKLSKVDGNVVRGFFWGILPEYREQMTTRFKKHMAAFMNGQSLGSLAANLKATMRLSKNIGHEISSVSWYLNLDQKKKFVYYDVYEI